jgi:hypothetical protein
MELVQTFTSVAAILMVVTAIIDIVKNWYFSPNVQHVVKMAIVLVNSPPSLAEIEQGAIMVITYISTALINAFKSLPPVLMETMKYSIIAVAKLLHLVIHIVVQAVIFVRHMFNFITILGKSIFVVLRSVNEGLSFIWSFTETYLTPFVDWLFTHPVRSTNWYITCLVVIVVLMLPYFIKWVYKQRKQKIN